MTVFYSGSEVYENSILDPKIGIGELRSLRSEWHQKQDYGKLFLLSKPEIYNEDPGLLKEISRMVPLQLIARYQSSEYLQMGMFENGVAVFEFGIEDQWLHWERLDTYLDDFSWLSSRYSWGSPRDSLRPIVRDFMRLMTPVRVRAELGYLESTPFTREGSSLSCLPFAYEFYGELVSFGKKEYWIPLHKLSEKSRDDEDKVSEAQEEFFDICEAAMICSFGKIVNNYNSNSLLNPFLESVKTISSILANNNVKKNS